MFSGTSYQTMREPDLRNPYRVDLGTAMFGNTVRGKEHKNTSWVHCVEKQKHDDHTKHDTHKKHDDHTKYDEDIAAMEAEHEKARSEHRITGQNVKNTEERLKNYDEQLKKVNYSHEENKNAEMAKKRKN
jgi:hypothetical protein